MKEKPDQYTPGREQYHADGTASGSGNSWDAPVWPVNVYGAVSTTSKKLIKRLWFGASGDHQSIFVLSRVHEK